MLQTLTQADMSQATISCNFLIGQKERLMLNIWIFKRGAQLESKVEHRIKKVLFSEFLSEKEIL